MTLLPNKWRCCLLSEFHCLDYIEFIFISICIFFPSYIHVYSMCERAYYHSQNLRIGWYRKKRWVKSQSITNTDISDDQIFGHNDISKLKVWTHFQRVATSVKSTGTKNLVFTIWSKRAQSVPENLILLMAQLGTEPWHNRGTKPRLTPPWFKKSKVFKSKLIDAFRQRLKTAWKRDKKEQKVQFISINWTQS